MVEKLVTYLQMTAPTQLRPAARVAGLRLVRLEGAGRHISRIRRLHDAIAVPHLWSSLGRTEEEWEGPLTDPNRTHWIAEVGGTDVGWASLAVDSDGSVEIRSFGVVPEMVGQGYGGAFLTALVRRAWQLVDHSDSARVWLHTSSWDHPNALANYVARGFTVDRLEVQEQQAGLDKRDGRAVERPPRFLTRPAVAHDRDAVATLIGDLGYELAASTAGQRLARLAGSPDDLVAVAVEHVHRTVGFLSAHFVPMFAEQQPGFVRITALVVSPRVARSGVGRRLIDLVEYWARSNGAALLEVSSGLRPERAAAHEFYRGLGFEDTAPDSVRYWKRLDEA